MKFTNNDDLIGKRFGRLILTDQIKKGKGYCNFLCRCDCGNEKWISKYNILKGSTTSCGCYLREATSRRNKGKGKHLRSGEKIYKTWTRIKDRCFNPNATAYNRYGGRGLGMCVEWKRDAGAFIEWAKNNGYTDSLTIERIDVNGDYSPDNCKWIPMCEQYRNMRKSVYIGEYTLMEFCRKYGLPKTSVRRYMKKGLSGKEILSKYGRTAAWEK